MITKIVNTLDGLVNRMLGTVIDFYAEPPGLSVSPTPSPFFPTFILVQLDDPEADQSTRRKYHNVIQNNSTATPISKEVRFRVGRYEVAQVSRRQFPLKLAWASIIHKIQGLTLSKIVLSCKGRFGPGLF